MKEIFARCFSVIIILSMISCAGDRKHGKSGSPGEKVSQEWALVIHGGAGVITREKMTPELDREYRESLDAALYAGESILKAGGTALDAVEAVVRLMEDNPLFNAGKGAVFNHDGYNELDASIMDGSTLKAGAVTCVTDIKNPVTAARRVMTATEHVLLSGAGASQFAKEQGLEIVDPGYFHTDRRFGELQEALKKEKNGTVGCCALDKAGNLAAATSTGGRTNKRYNRIGDTPIIGAGNYANNNTCAVSGTGHGEYFMRWNVAYDISALMEYRGLTVDEAAGLVVNEKLMKAGGSGGVIALDRYGNVSMPFNSEGMFRGFSIADGRRGVFIYRDEIQAGGNN